MRRRALLVLAVLFALQTQGAGLDAPDPLSPAQPLMGCHELSSASTPDRDPFLQRVLRYTKLALSHRVSGLASYYSTFFEGRKTANGEVYRNGEYSAAHLTLPLGTWIEVTSRATGRRLRMRINDRGPYAKKFCLDLSQAAARYLGVDRAPDRHVDIRIIALPGEDPLPDAADEESTQMAARSTSNER
ncbi:MAG TPA: septal ring lytic transglycosylase RlpA family protein [Thermoanaerobaculia bacterium]|nr:septal ring lytic transglycosylase RlpA family protein [Thermoanaerobaculia bacterium]